MDNNILQAFFDRKSIRKYKDTPVSKEQIERLVEVALISPSSRNGQPWHLTVLTNKDLIARWEKEIVQHFIDENEEWAVKHMESRNNKVFYDAPVAFVITMTEGSGIDVGIMVQSIAIAAKAMGLDSVILGFPRVTFLDKYEGKWQKELGIPEDHVYGVSIAVGYADEKGRDRDIDRSKVSYIL
jgi:nitroreductase